MAENGGSRVFLDAAGSAPMSARARDALLAALDDGWADPSRLHGEARRARALVDGAREAIAAVVGASAELTRFTHSPYTALSLALTGVARARRGRDRVLVSSVERVAILEAAEAASPGGVVTVPVAPDGLLDRTRFEAEIHHESISVAAIQYANRETGVIQHLPAAHTAAHLAGVPLVVDATASIGHVDPPSEWDALAMHPADWGGPGGIGVTALRASTRWLPADSAKNPWAPGGVNVPAALAAAVALEERESGRAKYAVAVRKLRDRLVAACTAHGGVAALALGDAPTLPHVATLVCAGVDGEALQAELDRRGFAVGSGSACTAGDFPRSHVLDAMGVATVGNVRIGLHPGITEADVDAFARSLADALAALRA